MSDKPETLADILAEMRREERPYGISNDRLRSYADRIERAAERERNAHTNDIHDALYMATGIPGNAAAMREALTALLRWVDDHCLIGAFDEGSSKDEIRREWNALATAQESARAALAAPARNVDRFATAEEAYAAWQKHNSLTAICDWLFAPAQKGDAE